MRDASTLTAGIDISKDKLDVAIHGAAKGFGLANSPAGWRQLAARLAQAVVRLPELGRIGREQAPALAGLAPFVHQSGKHVGETHIGGGRSGLRRALYRAALAAAFRWNPALVALYARLRARGKPHACALVACARKLLIYANAVVARATPRASQAAASA